MHSTFKRFAYATALASALTVAACGGHNDSDVTERVPDSASRSVDGFIAYLKKLVDSSADFLEPVDVSGVTAPTDDTGDPAAL